MESIPLDFTETPAVENDKYGDKMQFEAFGPNEKTRTKTDFCWLVGFILYLVVWIIIIIYAFSTGSTSKGLKPRDSAGRICGYDLGVESKPYLVHYNPDSCDLPYCLVCLSECPQRDFDFEEFDRRTKRSPDLGPNENPAVENQSITTEIHNKYSKKELKDIEELGNIMEKEITDNGKNMNVDEKKTDENDAKKTFNIDEAKLDRVIEKEMGVIDKNLKKDDKIIEEKDKNGKLDDNNDKNQKLNNSANEPSMPKPSSNNNDAHKLSGKFGQAIANIICQSDVNLDLIKKMDELKYFVDRGKCSRTYKKSREIHDNRCGFNWTTSLGHQFEKSSITRDLYKAKYSIMGFIMLSGLIALVSIFLMRWYALAYVCISIFVICAAAFHYIYEKCVLNAESKTNGVLLALFLGVVTLVIVVLIAIYFRKELCLACQMIKESCKAITCVLSSLAVPLFFFIIYTLFFLLGVCSYYLLSSLESSVFEVDFADGEKCECPSNLGYSQYAACDPVTFNSQCQRESGTPCVLSGCYMERKRMQSVGFLHFVNWVGLAWSFLFISGFNDIVLASVFSTWYWTFNKKILSYLTVIESFWRIATYHLGTVALGSLIIAICTIVQTILKFIKRRLNKSNRPCAAVILLSLKCLFDAGQNLIEFINRRAYIICAMHGTDFLRSSRTAYSLFMRNKERVLGVVAATNCLTFFTNVTIACLTTRIAVGYYETYRADDLSYTSTSLLLIFLGSYAICCMFMQVVEIAVGTVFVCFLEDTERNDGTNEKPYFMSEELTKFLYRK